MIAPMSKESAIAFFSEFYGGEHHLSAKIQPWGDGWCITIMASWQPLTLMN